MHYVRLCSLFHWVSRGARALCYTVLTVSSGISRGSCTMLYCAHCFIGYLEGLVHYVILCSLFHWVSRGARALC